MSGIQMIGSGFKVLDAQAMESSLNQKGPPPSIIVANQPIKDGKIVLAQVVSDGQDWVVIHRQNGDGTMGEMVGFAKVNQGVNNNVAVPLDLNHTSTIMYAMLHEDRAKLASPNFPGADVPVMVGGNMVAPTFEITSSANADVVIRLGTQPDTQNVLVDGNGMSLYVSLKDTQGKSNCDAQCQTTWRPVLATGRIIAGNGVKQSNIGILLQPNGSRQVTYLGAPLYEYNQDEAPGDVKGQGLDGSWYLVTP